MIQTEKMKNYLFTSVFCMLFMGINAQNLVTPFKLISTNDYVLLQEQMSSEIELLTPEVADFFTARETINQLKSFFNDLSPTDWKEKHVGGTKGGMSTYSVGNFKNSSGVAYRLYIVKDKVGEDMKIVSIEIEEI